MKNSDIKFKHHLDGLITVSCRLVASADEHFLNLSSFLVTVTISSHDSQLYEDTAHNPRLAVSAEPLKLVWADATAEPPPKQPSGGMRSWVTGGKPPPARFGPHEGAPKPESCGACADAILQHAALLIVFAGVVLLEFLRSYLQLMTWLCHGCFERACSRDTHGDQGRACVKALMVVTTGFFFVAFAAFTLLALLFTVTLSLSLASPVQRAACPVPTL